MLPLDGLRVLDLTRLFPGAYCTMLMADLGADVVKVEEPGKGDYMRWMPPFAPTGEGAWHLALNRGKRSMTVNLRVAAGREVLRRLAGSADVLVESFRPGVLDRLGVGYAALREVNPRLVYVAISGYGATGPYVGKAGHDINYLAYAGVLSFTGHPQAGPWQPGIQVGDFGGGGLMGFAAALVALRSRESTGEGQFCDVSMTDGLMSWLGPYVSAHAADGHAPSVGTTILNGELAAYSVYTCADGRHLAVGALEDQFFVALVEALGVPELAPWHVDRSRQEELRARLAEIFASRPRDEWVALLGDLDACVAPVLGVDELSSDPSVQARGMVSVGTLSDGTAWPQLGVVPRLAGTPGRAGAAPSALGADTDAVLGAAGWSAAEIAELRAAGAV